MARFFLIFAILAIIVVFVAAAGGTLPEGNIIRDATEWMRALGRKAADGFGGGYR